MSPERPAALGTRTVAALLDLAVVMVVFVVLGVLIGEAESSGGSASVNLSGLSALLFFALVFAYHCIADAHGGRTLGKALLGLRVLGADGAPLGLRRAALRTVLRVVDGLPAFYLVGFVCVLATRGQRIGDLAAGSRVVRR